MMWPLFHAEHTTVNINLACLCYMPSFTYALIIYSSLYLILTPTFLRPTTEINKIVLHLCSTPDNISGRNQASVLDGKSLRSIHLQSTWDILTLLKSFLLDQRHHRFGKEHLPAWKEEEKRDYQKQLWLDGGCKTSPNTCECGEADHNMQQYPSCLLQPNKCVSDEPEELNKCAKNYV